MGRNKIKVTKRNVYIAIDNGVTGTIGVIIVGGNTIFHRGKEYTKKELSYTKVKKNITRIDVDSMLEVLGDYEFDNVKVMLERPLVNPGRLVASLSGIRALEATLIVLEYLGYGYSYVDSKEWQKALLPKGSTGPKLKVDSANIGCRLFPQHTVVIKQHKDADGLLMAEYCRRFHLGLL